MGINQILKADSGTPNVIYYKQNNELNIEGVCMPENALEMFKDVFDNIMLLDKQKLTINLKLKYINSMSSKQLLRLLITSIDRFDSLNINWFYKKEDELMKMKGEELKSILDFGNFIIQAD